MLEEIGEIRQIHAFKKEEPRINFVRAFVFVPIIGLCATILRNNVPKLGKDITKLEYYTDSRRIYDGSIDIDLKYDSSSSISPNNSTNLSENLNIPSLYNIIFRHMIRNPQFRHDIIPFSNENSSSDLYIHEFHNYFVNTDGIVFKYNQIYRDLCNSHPSFCNNSYSISGKYSFTNLSKVINFASQFNDIQTLFLVYIPYLLIIPKSFLKSCTILVKEYDYTLSLVFEYINMSNTNIISLRDDELIFAEKLYCVTPSNCAILSYSSLRSMRYQVYKHLKLEEYGGSKNYLYLMNEKRRGYNLTLAQIRILSIKYNINWEIFEPERTFAKMVKKINKINVFVCISSNILVWTVFMPMRASVVEIPFENSNFNYAVLQSVNEAIYKKVVFPPLEMQREENWLYFNFDFVMDSILFGSKFMSINGNVIRF